MTRPLVLDDLYQFRFVSDPQLSPDGGRVAFVVTHADRAADEWRSQIWRVDVSGGQPEQLTFGDADTSPRWAPDGSALAFVAEGRIWIASGDGAARARKRALTTDALGAASQPAWSPDGSCIAFIAGVGAGGGADSPAAVTRLGSKLDGLGLVGDRCSHLVVVDAASGRCTKLAAGDFSMADPAWSPDGTRLAFTDARHDDRDVHPGSALFVMPVAGGEVRQVTPDHGWARAPAWAPDGRSLVYVGAVHNRVGHMRLLAVPADGGPPTELAPDLDRNVMVGAPAYPGAPPRVRADGTVLFCGRDGGCTHAYRVPLAGGAAEKVVGGETRSVYGMSAASDSDTFAFIAASPQSPSEVWVTTITGNDQQQQLRSFTASALPDLDLFPAERRTFTAPDGLTIEGWLIRDPAAPTPGPLLLDVHGGPHNAWGPAFDGIELHHQELARRGWTVLLVNARGSDGYGEVFYRALTGRWGRADGGDFLAAVDAVVAEGLADDRRVAVSGYSYGGYMTCWLTTQTNRFTAAVAGGCVANLTSFVGTSDMGPRIALELGALPFEDPARYADLSPISHVADVRTPTLVLHGDADLRCPLGQAEEWFSALRLKGQEVALVRYPGGDHLLQVRGRPSHRVDYSQRLADWVCGHDGPTVQT